jgi:predicted nuclease of predicted toxin-antitoxin system
MRQAVGDDRVLVSADADFGALLAGSMATAPSVVLLRPVDDLTPGHQTFPLTSNLPAVADDPGHGAVVVLRRRRIRVRDLPIGEV